jgi:predicted HicB family RNase H-like nuclease
MDILKYKDYEGSAELDMSRGVCRGKILLIDDLVTYEASTPTELQMEFEAAVDDYLETCTMLGKAPSRPFRGMFNVRVAPALHRAASLRAAAEQVSLNDVVVRALSEFVVANSDDPDKANPKPGKKSRAASGARKRGSGQKHSAHA